MELFRYDPDTSTRWVSFENPSGAPGQGALSNLGAKGAPSAILAAGEEKVLLDLDGPGIIRRIWITVRERSPHMLRGLRLRLWWDGAADPAVDCPLGDFFGVGLGRLVPFESALFSNPEGRSFNAAVPMPFRRHARITLTNETAERQSHLFYDVDLTLHRELPADALYFHAHWRRENPNTLGTDFAILPAVQGQGRFLGTNLGVITDPIYRGSWWGEGEVKVELDGDTAHPTLVGTGTEDYIGAAWGQGVFSHRHQGCLICDGARGHYAFYRYHLPDPVVFHQAARVTIQQIGGTNKATLREILAAGAPAKLVVGGQDGHHLHALAEGLELESERLADDDFVGFWRQDDWSATSYFYLNRPASGLPALAPVAARVAGLD